MADYEYRALTLPPHATTGHAREVLGMPVRIAAPTGIGGLVDTILNPSYSSAVGLLLWGASTLAEDEPMRYESAPASGGLGRLRDALRSIFP